MLYFSDKTPHAWRKLARLISEREAVDVVVFLYPGAEVAELPPPFTGARQEEGLERVTSYGDGDVPPHSARLPVDGWLLDRLEEVRSALEEVCDNFALYPPGKTEWVACSIPHEGMCMVKDGALEEGFRAIGLTPSSEPPSWW